MCPITRQDSHEPPPASTVADRLKSARRRRFVGRAAELELFLAALAASEPPFSVLWVHGPAGLARPRCWARSPTRRPTPASAVVSLDLRAIEPVAAGVHGRARRARSGARRGVSAGGARRPRACGAAAGHLRGRGRPRGLAAGAVRPGAAGVRADRGGGQGAPGEAWRRDPGWGDLLRVVSLRNLGPDDARAFLRGAGVAEEQQGWMLELSHGHPLRIVAAGGRALAAAARRSGAAGVGRGARRGGAAGRELPRRGAEPAPSAGARVRGPRAAHHGGPAAAASSETRGRELFAWLRGLSFMEYGPHGLFPHDLARE